MDVYLDAVFCPLIYSVPEILRQEGWHYELSEDGRLTINGVVYNEMKGALSSPDEMSHYALMRELFQNTYGFVSGGDPDAIPGLSEKAFLDFHRRFYHPSNCCICIYGDMDGGEVMDYIDKNYLSRYERLKDVPAFVQEKPFTKRRIARSEYPVADAEAERESTYISMGFVTGDAADAKETMTMEILTSLLMNSEAAPLKNAILDAGVGKNVAGKYDALKQGVFSITVDGAEQCDADKLNSVVTDCLNGLVADGIDERQLEAAINKHEFSLREAEEAERLKSIKDSMSAAELDAIREGQSRLSARQDTPDSPEVLATVPRLTLADVKKEARILDVCEYSIAGVRVLRHEAFTSGVAYVDAMFDMSALDPREQQLAAVLCYALDKLGTGGRDYRMLALDMDIYTGGISAEVNVTPSVAVRDEFACMATVSMKALTSKLEAAFEIFGDMILSANFTDTARLRQVITMLDSSLTSSLQERSDTIAMMANLACVSAACRCEELVTGASFDRFVSQCVKRDTDALASELAAVAKKLFVRANLTLCINGGSAELSAFNTSAARFIEMLPTGEKTTRNQPFNESIERVGFASASMVQYVSMGYDITRLGYAYSGSLLAVKNLLTSGYLWNTIRIKGGAYYASISIMRDGVICLMSYDDPNLESTIEAYEGIGNYLRTVELTEDDVANNIISAISRLDAPLLPEDEGDAAFRNYISGMTPERIRREREELLLTTVADFRRATDILDAIAGKKCLAVFGSAERVNGAKALFDRVESM